MNQVNIPTDFFLNEAKREYCYLAQRLVAELFQNAVDAGAKNIHFKFDETSYTCEDDGCGMDEDRLVSAMLTLGGSIKDSNSTGGFGAAKKLILFAHKSYIIITNDIHVQGECLSYNLVNGTKRKGTFIHAEYLDSSEFDINSMLSAVDEVLGKSYKKNINVTVNGKKFDVPFQMMLIVATNLETSEVSDGAFLRRMGYRIHMENPSEEDYRTVFLDHQVQQTIC